MVYLSRDSQDTSFWSETLDIKKEKLKKKKKKDDEEEKTLQSNW